VQLGGLQKRISDIEKLNSEVIAISTSGNQYDVKLTKSFLGITYILVPIPNKKVVEDYGLVYRSDGFSLAAYATFIIDKKGRIRYKRADEAMNRTSISRIIRELQGI
jgi:peroxiredoxin